jgi:hypothetical protein
MILTDLTKSGYLLLKKDRVELINQISELQSLLDDFDFAYPFLESIFEPKTNLITKDGVYYGQISIIYPTAPAPILIEFEVGKVSMYNSTNQSNLQEDLDTLSNQKLKEKFPLHFS